jgi:DNA-binding XRE family transcriptional regulator
MARGGIMRERRTQAGLTQAELAERAGVSRQLVAAVEAGRNVPAVDAALRLAGALGSTVDELFADSSAKPVAALGGPLKPGAGLRVGRVADRLVAAELADHGIAGAGWARPDGVLEGEQLRMFPGASPAGLVVAGCDPALGIAERMLDGLGTRSLLALSAPTGVALAALSRAGVHAAVVHGLQSELPEPPVAVTRWHLARWRVGVAVAPDLGHPSLGAVLASGIPIARRDPQAASQKAFDRARRAAGVQLVSGPRAAGHLDAARIAATLRGAGVTTEGAAHAFGLRFLPLEEHAVEVWVADRWSGLPGVAALGELLTSRGFTDRVAQFGGYDLGRCGERVEAT